MFMRIKSEMDTQSDSRKRPLDSDGDDGMTKRSNQGNLDPLSRDDVHLKMMVPSCAAGAVIGKGGETIGKLQRETGAKMKMSKNQDTFPGTSERVCLIVGTINACQLAHEEVAQIVSDKPDPQPKPSGDGDGKINYQRHQQTKFLIPNASAGVIIGKGGSYIKELKERSGSHVNVSHKGDNPERIVTVSGDVSEIRAAMAMILDKLAADPQSSLYPSLNYAGMGHGGGNMATPSNSYTNMGGNSMGGLNMGNMGGGGAMTPQQVQQAAQSLSTMMRSFNNLGSGINNLNIGTRPRNPVLEQLVQTLKLTGYTDGAAEEIASALATLANYGVLSLTGGSLLGNLMNLNRLNSNSSSGGSANGGQSGSVPSLLNNPTSQSSRMGGDQSALSNYGGAAAGGDDDSASLLRQLTQTLARTQGKSGGGDMYGPVGGVKDNPEGMGSMFGNSSLFGAESGGGGFGNFNQQSGSPEPQDSQEIEVAENLAGAIIGQQGRGITEIQHMTGANVSVSRRGVYAPGTQNRIVTVSGPSSGVGRAALLVRQKIQDAEQRRAQSTY